MRTFPQIYTVTIVAASVQVAEKHFTLEEGAFLYEFGPEKECWISAPEITSSRLSTHWTFHTDQNNEPFPTEGYTTMSLKDIEEVAAQIEEIDGISMKVFLPHQEKERREKLTSEFKKISVTTHLMERQSNRVRIH